MTFIDAAFTGSDEQNWDGRWNLEKVTRVLTRFKGGFVALRCRVKTTKLNVRMRCRDAKTRVGKVAGGDARMRTGNVALQANESLGSSQLKMMNKLRSTVRSEVELP